MMSIYEIREDKVDVQGKSWDDDDVQRLVYKQIYMYQKCYEYWTWCLERGRDLFLKYDGKILSDYQRAQYEDVEDKVVIEQPIMKSPIRSLVGHIMKARRSGQVITEGGSYDEPYPSGEEIASINIVLKDFEKKIKEKVRFRDAVHDSFVSCYPNVIMFDKAQPSYDYGLKGCARNLPWDSVVFGPVNFREPDGSDLKEIFWFEPRTQADLEENFPEMKEQIKAHCSRDGKKIDASMISSLMQWDGDSSSEDRNYLWSILDNANTTKNSPTGLVPVVQHLYPIKRKEEVWVNMFDESGMDYEVRPENWSDTRWEKWQKENPQYKGPYEREVVTLWTTVFTLTGLCLSNGKHWYQEGGRLPAVFFIPAMVSGMPTGPAADMSADVLRNCVAQIEWLDDIRKGHGVMAFFKEGALVNQEEITEEANKAFGVGIISKNFQGSVRDAVVEVRREPSDKWLQYGQQAKTDMYENTRLNETMQGEAAPRQAAIAKNIEIAQALTVNAMYIDNINQSWENLQDLKCSLIPYFYDEYMVVECFDEDTNTVQRQEVNVAQYDQNGDRTAIVNDLTSRRYRWKINPVDDSAIAKARMMEEALMIINGAAGPLLQKDPSGKMFANFLMAFPNDYLNKAGKAMVADADAASQGAAESNKQQAMQDAMIEMKKAEADLIRAKKQGLNLNINGDQLVQYPALFAFYNQLQQMFGEAQGGAAAPAPMTPQPMMAGPQPMQGGGGVPEQMPMAEEPAAMMG